MKEETLLLWKVPWPSYRKHAGLRVQGHDLTIHIPLFCEYWGVSWTRTYKNCFYYRYTDNEEFRSLPAEISSIFNDIKFVQKVHDAHSNKIQVWTSIPFNDEGGDD